MKILLVGSGGREHALAWKLSQSPRLGSLYTLPGNPGTALVGTNLPGNPDDPQAVLYAALTHKIDLVVVGPEAPLAAGLADVLVDAGIPVFGPSRAAAQLESSKAFAKNFMLRHAIPTARFSSFNALPEALAYLHTFEPGGCVIKASGLAAGKGVYLPDTQAEAEAILARSAGHGHIGPGWAGNRD